MFYNLNVTKEQLIKLANLAMTNHVPEKIRNAAYQIIDDLEKHKEKPEHYVRNGDTYYPVTLRDIQIIHGEMRAENMIGAIRQIITATGMGLKEAKFALDSRSFSALPDNIPALRTDRNTGRG